MRKRIKVVVDTNVIVSGILTQGTNPSKIIDAWIKGKFFIPVLSKELQEEVNVVFGRPKIQKRFTLSKHELHMLLGILFNKAEKVEPKGTSVKLFADSKDHFLLDLAVFSDAKIIVSGDLGILEHLNYAGIAFLTPEKFCKKLKIK